MSNSATEVEIGESRFDVAAVGEWIGDNIWLCLLIAFVVFVFWLFQKGGFAEKLLDYRIKKRELEAKQLEDARKLGEILTRRYERDDPLLPFGEQIDGNKP